ncbi:MAG: ASPIC/UnbV domain-containing protein, partial [Candidatus Latescibacteria bacterium]|nr:ASPIC/UnbV domain-containing protein [Candidatus Latescibacterota bacterium]
DNDGDLEIFQAAGSSGGGQYRSLLLLNLGEGQFLDVTEAVGLGALGAFNLQGTGLADIDNDGDLDLLTNDPLFLFLNDGTGIFSDHTSQSGLEGGQLSYGLSFADYDQDGFLDVLLGAVGPHPGSVGVFHNQGNANHWLQVELVGAASNRSGIGARLIATAGKLQQLREIFGGRGLNQDDLVAHFGLGDRVRIDRLEVRWPSGQVDVLTDIPADQKIRVFEGRTSYHPIVPARGGVAPDTLVIGRPATLTLAVQPALFEPNATITQVTADLSPFGGPDSVPLAPTSDGTWTMETLPLSVTGANGVRSLHLMIDQQTSLGLHWTQLSRSVGVLPAADLVVFGDALAQGWQVKTPNKVEFDFEARTVVFSGKAALALNPSSFFWTVQCLPAEPVRHFGYTALRFAFHPGEVIPPRDSKLSININKEQIDLLGPGQALVDLEAKDWQVVEVPLDFLEADEPITLLTFQGNLKGTFYLDDIRLVAVSPPPLTVVEEERTASLPQAFSLSQNFPNPFNSDTVIRFALPEGGEVVLAVYNLAGQQVAKLAEGTREAGSYTLRWDGRDERGKELASGVYLYRLRAGAQVETQKLVLLR